jgi:uncharacterized membrane-anchored protein
MRQSLPNTVAYAIVGTMLLLTFGRWLDLGYEMPSALLTLALAVVLLVWALRGSPWQHRQGRTTGR